MANTPPGVLHALQPAWPLQLQLLGENAAPSAAATPPGHRSACHTSHFASGLCSSDLQASALQISARQHQSQGTGAKQQSPAPRQLLTPGSSLSSPLLGQAMPGSRAPSHAKVTPGPGNQTHLYLQALAANERPAADSWEQTSKAHRSCSRLQWDSRAGSGSAQLPPGLDATSGGPHVGGSLCLAQGSPMCLSPVVSDSAAAALRRAAGEACPTAGGAGHAQRSSLHTAAAAPAAGRQQPGPERPNRAAAARCQTGPGLGCAPACVTPPSPAVCAALWLYGTSQSQQPSSGLPTGGPLQPVTAAHALAAGNASNCPGARPAQAKISSGPRGKRSADVAVAPGAGAAGSPGKRHRVQPGCARLPAPAPQAARAYLKALAQPAPAAAPLPGPDVQADTASQKAQQQHQEAGEQGGAPHSHSKPLAAGVSWYELHRPSEQALSQQAEQETVERRLRHLQVRSS